MPSLPPWTASDVSLPALPARTLELDALDSLDQGAGIGDTEIYGGLGCKTMSVEKVPVYVPAGDYKRLLGISKLRNVSVASLIHEAIVFWLEKKGK